MPTLTYGALADSAADSIVAAIKRVEGVVVGSTSRVAGLTGRVSVVTTPAPVRRLRARSNRAIAGRLPSTREVVEANFTMAERVLRAQKEYTLHVLSAAAREQVPVSRPAARPPAKATAKSSRPRKAAATTRGKA